MSENQRKKKPLCRPRFTEKDEQQTEVKEKSRSKSKEVLSTKVELLDKLRTSKVITGNATIGMMEKFRKFP